MKTAKLSELIAKYGADEPVYLIVTKSEIDFMLVMDGISKNDPAYSEKFRQFEEIMVRAYQVFIDSLDRVTAYMKQGLRPLEMRKKLEEDGIVGNRGKKAREWGFPRFSDLFRN